MTLIIVHGLEGSSESQYVIGTGSKAWTAGMNVVRMNMRNCGDTEHLGPTLYNSSMSGDVGAIAQTLINEDGLQKLTFVGYSMGGNLVLKLLGEWGTGAPPQVKAAVGVSPAMDLAPSSDALHARVNRVYEWKFLLGLRRRILRKAALYPDRYDVRYLRGMRSLRDFDDQITARYSGFRDAQDYYTRAASSGVIDRIAVPTLSSACCRTRARSCWAIRTSPSSRQRRADIAPSSPLPTAMTAAGPSARRLPLSSASIKHNQSSLPPISPRRADRGLIPHCGLV